MNKLPKYGKFIIKDEHNTGVLLFTDKEFGADSEHEITTGEIVEIISYIPVVLDDNGMCEITPQYEIRRFGDTKTYFVVDTDIEVFGDSIETLELLYGNKA